jgi:ABC-type transporter Mla subunit MlaD
MRRIAFTLVLLALSGAAVAATAGAEDKRTYEAELFNAFGLVEGSELRVAGVTAGTVTNLDITPEKTALVTFEVGPGFPEFKSDASCSSEPQSLIAEYFLDCQPGSASDPLEGPIEASRNQTTVQNDLVQNTLREPFKRRFQLILNEFGTALVGNAENLNAAIRAGAPALREFKQVLNILGRQNTIIAQLNVDADEIFARLTERREDVVEFIDEAEDTARASADRREDLSRDFDLLDDFLFELRPVMHELGNLARAQTPLLIDLKKAAPGLNKLGKNLPRFNDGARVSLKALGGAADVGRRALVKGRDEIAQLNETSLKAPPAADIIADLLESLDDPAYAVEESCFARRDLRELPGEADRRVALLEDKLGRDLTGLRECEGMAGAGTGPAFSEPGSGNPGYTALEGLLNYGYIQTLSLNLFDIIGHGLHFTVVGAPGISGECGHTNTEQDYEAVGGGETTDPRQAIPCVGVLGDTQPGINIGKDPSAPGQWSLTGDLPPYDPRVCPGGPGPPAATDSQYEGAPSTYFCDPNAAPQVESAGFSPAAATPAPSSAPGDEEETQQDKIDDLLERLRNGEIPSEEELREILGLGPNDPLPPEIEAALGSVGLGGGGASEPSPQTEDRAVSEDLLDFLFGP